ncbi:MAG: ATP-binding cassette domain-containing protein [Butyrivibrio sp.]
MIIRVNNVYKRIGRKEILNNIKCTLGKGMTFVVGDSGAGKSTLLNIMGLLDDATEGEILYGSNEQELKPVDRSDTFRAKHIGFVFQDSNLINGLTVYQNIELALSISGKKISKKDIDDYLAKFSLSHVRDEKVQVLSGGERQRAAIVRALIKDSDVILADEPTGNLDSANAENVFRELKQISEDKTVIIITHNLDKAKEYADRIIKIKDGQIESDIINSTVVSNYETQHDMSIKTGKLKFPFVKMLSLNNIFRHKGKFISVVAAIAFAFAVVMGIISVNYVVNNKINDMNYSYYDADLVNIYATDYTQLTVEDRAIVGESIPFTDEEIEYFSSCKEFAEVVPIPKIDIFLEGTYDSVDVKYIKTDEFFEKRIMNDSIEGSFPKTDNEIIIGEDIAESVFNNDAIGRKLVLESDYIEPIEFTVVGVNHMKNVDGVYYTYISSEIILDTYKENFISYINFAYIIEDFSITTITGGSLGVWLTTLNTQDDIIFGSAPAGPYEIGINTQVFNDLYWQLVGEEIDLAESELSEEQISRVLNESYYLGANNAYKVKITGIYNLEDRRLIAEEKWLKQISKTLPVVLQCYTVDMDAAENFNPNSYNSGYTFESYYQERFMFAVRTNDTVKYLMGVILLVTVLLTAAMTNSFIKISCSERIYEIGILKSLGTTMGDIRKLLVFDCLLLGICSGIMADIFYLVFICVLPKISDLSIQSVSVSVVICICCIAVSVLLCVLSGILKINKYARMKPVDAIRSRT